ncbi:carbon-nitrogen hydrolase family protein [Propioniferax innocua]|uniref:Putative amidohydrolase n=1 Tax=Propioniferax innocua TaxID=1753 RepID=A0A542ZC11_9ACTN|nr:carbon-nitrogen hydrolase family protein [Propioniferax innocua]TQL57847.1 putative amidohydrolase [Propioniferax innocua]
MRIGLAQICTSRDLDANLQLVADHAARAAERSCDVVLFPEATMRAFGHNLTEIAQPIDGPWAEGLRSIADEHGITVVAGMFTPAPDGEKGARVHNTLLAVGNGVDTSYDKIHLYDAFGFSESDTVAAGEEQVRIAPATDEALTLGLATCYDVRFPQLFIDHARAGAAGVLLPASWGAGPGKVEQWELLVRARALDSTSWILACGQAEPSASGVEAKPKAPTGVGHSMIVSPDGRIVARAGAAPELLVADIDDPVSTRESIPVLTNARLS